MDLYSYMRNIVELCTVSIELKNNKRVSSRTTCGLLHNLLCWFYS